MTRKELVFVSLAGLFVANALLGELLGGKLIQWGPFTLSVGVIPWPMVFLSTDLIHEYFGRKGVRNLTLLTVVLILYAFAVTFASMAIPAASFSPVGDEAFNTVFGQSLWIIAGSVTAFLVSQFVDVAVFWYFRVRTGSRMLWLRATGSTVVSQLIDTIVIGGIAFLLPGKITFEQFASVSLTNYTYKLLVAVSSTPLIYVGHMLVGKFLSDDEPSEMVKT